MRGKMKRIIKTAQQSLLILSNFITRKQGSLYKLPLGKLKKLVIGILNALKASR